MKALVKELIEVSTELRLAIKTLEFSKVSGLIERYQTLANRAESILEEESSFFHLKNKRKELQKEIKELKKKKPKDESVE